MRFGPRSCWRRSISKIRAGELRDYGGDVNDRVEYPGLIWLKDPIHLDGQPTGAAPRRRHHEDCPHFERSTDGSILGPAPYRASEEQMHTIDFCRTCAEMSGESGSRSRDAAGRRGAVCRSCFMERPLTGACPNCGDE